MKRTTIAILALLLAACGAPLHTDYGEDLFAREDLNVERALLVDGAGQKKGEPRSLESSYLRVAWGMLAGNPRCMTWTDWTGGVTGDRATVTLQKTQFFDRHDSLLPPEDPARLAWRSRTAPHFDGLIFRLDPEDPGAFARVDLNAFTHDFPAAELANGVNRLFEVGPAGNQVIVSSVRANDEGAGFAWGIYKVRDGVTGFRGQLLGADGGPLGLLRMRAENGELRAKLVNRAGELLGTGAGRLTGGGFELTLDLGEGEVRTVRGISSPSSYSPRGSFHGTVSRQ